MSRFEAVESRNWQQRHAEQNDQARREAYSVDARACRPDPRSAAPGALPSLDIFGQDGRSLIDCGRQQADIERARQTLTDARASAGQSLNAVESLARAGVTDIQLADRDGTMRSYRVEQASLGGRTMVHLFARDDRGREHVVLRGLASGDGTYVRERGADGRFVDFQGSWWSQNMGDRSAVTAGRPVAPDAPVGPLVPPSPAPGPEAITAMHLARGTGYYPANNAMEGGFNDRHGRPLRTLQDFLAGRSDYVSVAMDKNAGIADRQLLHIPELDHRYREQLDRMGLAHIPFRVVDTGGAFTNRGYGRIDICTADRRAAGEATINGPLTVQFVDEQRRYAARQPGQGHFAWARRLVEPGYGHEPLEPAAVYPPGPEWSRGFGGPAPGRLPGQPGPTSPEVQGLPRYYSAPRLGRLMPRQGPMDQETGRYVGYLTRPRELGQPGQAGAVDPDSLARHAAYVASHMRSVGWCYRGVKAAAGMLGVHLEGRSAHQAKGQLENDPRFEKVAETYNLNPQQLRPGDIIVHPRNYLPGHPDGHIAVYLGGGTEASDHIQRLIGGAAAVFRPRSGGASQYADMGLARVRPVMPRYGPDGPAVRDGAGLFGAQQFLRGKEMRE